VPYRVWLSFVVLVAGVGLLAAAAVSGPAQKKGGTLRISGLADFGSDPGLAYTSVSWMFEFATCAKLYSYPDKPAPAGALVMPEVAKGFPKVSRDGRTQTIELKRSYRFHTGQRITAANFVAAFNRDASPKLQSPATAYMHEIVGAKAVMSGKAGTISGVRARGPYMLQIRTTRPLPDLVSRLTMPFFCPIATSTPLREISNPLDSGPYHVTSHVPNRQLVLERNGFYRGPRPANVDRVVWSVGLGQEACRQQLERDELDRCYVLPANYQEIAGTYGINRPNGQFFFNPMLGTGFFAFNHDRPSFSGPGQIPLKQAINWAIDRPALVRVDGFLGAKRTDQILPPAMGRNASIYPLGSVTERSLARARALLAKANFKPQKLVLYTASIGRGPFATWAQIFQFNLKRLGITVEIKYFSFTELFERVSTRGEPFDVTINAFIADYADPITFFGAALNGRNLKQTGNTNLAYFDRPKYNRAIERIDRLSGEPRRKAWADLDVEMMRDDPPWAPFENPAERDFVSKSFGCYVFQPVLGRPDIAAACKR
jgi:peptide/nickel transport system substrate-binding protein